MGSILKGGGKGKKEVATPATTSVSPSLLVLALKRLESGSTLCVPFFNRDLFAFPHRSPTLAFRDQPRNLAQKNQWPCLRLKECITRDP